MRIKPVALSIVVLLSAVSMPAFADDTNCQGSLGNVKLDDLHVPSGATCTLKDTTIDGNIKVGSNGNLKADGIRVDGDIQAENASSVTVANSTIDGNIQIE